jgi:hypothetical protein
MEANDRKKKIAIELPHTVGLCGKTTPVVIELAEGKKFCASRRKAMSKGLQSKTSSWFPTRVGLLGGEVMEG